MTKNRKFRRPSPAFAPASRQAEAAESPRREVAPASKGRAGERTAVILETGPDQDYALIDCGNGRKLERLGGVTIIRPEGQAIWRPALPEARWARADAVFTGDTDEEGIGRWQFPGKPLAETWPAEWNGIPYLGRFTSFRHVGVFPEQAAHWRFIEERLAAAGAAGGHPPRLLNLFGYTGLASLVAARAGAHVTHVDASRKAIGWARENQERAGLSDHPVRWICEDAVRFCEREVRRGSVYEAILLDPPAYGRGPKGEVWQFFDDIPYLLGLTRKLLGPRPLFIVLTAYTIRASFFAIHELMQEFLGDSGGIIESGELVIRAESGGRRLSTSMFSRWIAP